jgi:tetratricopeptide (TPR) repeat protein
MPEFDFSRVDCLRRGSEIAEQRDDPREGIARLEAARRLLSQSPFDSDWEELLTLMNLGEAYRIAGRNSEAVVVFERLNALVSHLGREETQSAGVLFNDWALSLQRLGRQLEAEKLFRRSIDIYRAGQTEDTVPPVILTNYATTLRMLGRLDAAADYAERAYAKARQGGGQFTLCEALAVRAQVYIDQGNVARAAAALAELEPILRRTVSPDTQWFAWLSSIKALLEMAEGNLPQALAQANQSVSIAEASSKARGQVNDFLSIALARRAQVEMEAAEPIQAAADVNRALSQMQSFAQPGTYSNYIGDAYLVLGRSLRAQGKNEEARTAFLSAANHLEYAVGPDNPRTVSARQLADSGSRNP